MDIKGFFNKSDFGLLVIRVVVGGFMMYHGITKFMAGAGALESLGKAVSVFGISAFPLMFGILAALTESLGGFLMLIGYKFRIAVAFLFIVMFVGAYSTFDGLSSLGNVSRAIEMAAVFFGLLFIGPGKFSADKG